MRRSDLCMQIISVFRSAEKLIGKNLALTSNQLTDLIKVEASDYDLLSILNASTFKGSREHVVEAMKKPNLPNTVQTIIDSGVEIDEGVFLEVFDCPFSYYSIFKKLGFTPTAFHLNKAIETYSTSVAKEILESGVEVNSHHLVLAIRNYVPETYSSIVSKVNLSAVHLQEAIITQKIDLIKNYLESGIKPSADHVVSAIKHLDKQSDIFHQIMESKSELSEDDLSNIETHILNYADKSAFEYMTENYLPRATPLCSKLTFVEGGYSCISNFASNGTYIIAYGKDTKKSFANYHNWPAQLVKNGYDVVYFNLDNSNDLSQIKEISADLKSALSGMFILAHGLKHNNDHYVVLGDKNIPRQPFTAPEFSSFYTLKTTELISQFTKLLPGSALTKKFDVILQSCYSGAIDLKFLHQEFPMLQKLFLSDIQSGISFGVNKPENQCSVIESFKQKSPADIYAECNTAQQASNLYSVPSAMIDFSNKKVIDYMQKSKNSFSDLTQKCLYASSLLENSDVGNDYKEQCSALPIYSDLILPEPTHHDEL